ncbi:MAG: bacteriohemerythrin [Nitrospinota bacterium]|nr:bacteriohemerythrin [Nitrospinota bacterium]MDH5756136.1 bacteriohemerythrin [Nitrospinota bacterium]
MPGKKTAIEWSEEFSVGISKFDDQHKQIIKMINDLYDSLTDKGEDSRERMAEIAARLCDYTYTHFLAEEVEMYRHHYPQYESHKDNHDKLTSMARDFMVRIQSSDAGLKKICIELIATLSAWLKVHIKETDKRYTEFLKGKVGE